MVCGYVMRLVHYHDPVQYTIICTVPPSKPGNFRVDRGSITFMFARILWDLTNQTADAGADKLTLLLTYSNMSLVQEIELPGNAERVALDLIPGTEYVVQLRAENPDGMAITDALSVQTLNGSEYTYIVTVAHTYQSCSIVAFKIFVLLCKSQYAESYMLMHT